MMQVYCTAANVNYADLDIKARGFRINLINSKEIYQQLNPSGRRPYLLH